MSDGSAIEWTDATWNPVTGCTSVSPGCDHCYARTLTERFHGPGSFDVVAMHPDRLTIPLVWKRPRRVFVNSMSDLFHDDISDEFIAQVFAVMAVTPRHSYQVLTKRPGRMASLLGRPDFADRIRTVDLPMRGTQTRWNEELYPLPNVWLGTSVEDQRWADIRIPKLLETPATVRFLSCEPLLGPVTFRWALWQPWRYFDTRTTTHLDGLRRLDWIIVGGESGHGARPMDPAWVRTLRDECVETEVPFFFKQWGGRTPKSGGRELDGRTWDEYPRELVSA